LCGSTMFRDGRGGRETTEATTGARARESERGHMRDKGERVTMWYGMTGPV
jgi:hypothetical protein